MVERPSDTYADGRHWIRNVRINTKTFDLDPGMLSEQHIPPPNRGMHYLSYVVVTNRDAGFELSWRTW